VDGSCPPVDCAGDQDILTELLSKWVTGETVTFKEVTIEPRQKKDIKHCYLVALYKKTRIIDNNK
jgi:hypothetical protein